MKRVKNIFCAVLSLCLLLGAAVPVSAASGDGYTYTIRFYAGRQGSFAAGEMMEIRDLHYGDRVNFAQSSVSLNDNSKYYIRGIRESGRDNNTVSQTPSFTVTGDRDYVVAYGILGDATSYTIHYVDEEGNALAPSETYYGNVGDRPVVAYLYIAGYRPQAYNMTKTLEKDPSENVFTFVYTLGEEEETPGGDGGTTEPGTPTVPTAPGGAEGTPEGTPGAVPTGVTVIPGGGAAGAGGGGGAADAGGGAAADAGGVAVPDEEVPLNEGPEELVDLDDEEVPLSGLPSLLEIGNDARLLGIPVPAVAAAGLALLGSWYLVVVRKKKKKEEES